MSDGKSRADLGDRFGEVLRIGEESAGEVLTLQRAAYVSEARLHEDLSLPPLTQSMEELVEELQSPQVTAFGVRDGARLVAAARLFVRGTVAELGRLTVVPDLQGKGLGSKLLESLDSWLPSAVDRVELFTGERSVANIRLYERFGFDEFRRQRVGAYELVFLARKVERK